MGNLFLCFSKIKFKITKMEKQTQPKQFNIRKKIAKHGCNSIIVIPKLLQGELKPKTIVDLEIKIVEEAE